MENITVSKDNDQNFRTVQSAINYSRDFCQCEIIVEEGVYTENLKIYNDNLTIKGNGKVTIEGNWFALGVDEKGQQRGTFQTATVFINANKITLEHLKIVNKSGPGERVGQAVALYIEGNDIYVKNCVIDGHQDTLCLGPLPKNNSDGTRLRSPWIKKEMALQKSKFLKCQISGTVDYIFGGGDSTFVDCCLHSKRNRFPTFITAASTSKETEGFIFINCKITGDSDYYLGRPWREYAKTMFQNCSFDRHLIYLGWNDWDEPKRRNTTRYEEINCIYESAPIREEWIKLKMLGDN